ncbi:MAG: bifunctional aspartate kinase/homoserine dehydrogenase I [Gammaproteobacteria bacterium]|nr:bifunctional aspartate kinase/homoserine dehydrogenase I [Gammaproteobacteria bacterium]
MQNKYNQYVVHKFGGSSLCNAARFIALKSLLRGQNEIIVVSAIQNTTQILQTLLDAARLGKPYLQELAILKQSHLTLVNNLLNDFKQTEILNLLQNDFAAITNVLEAIQIAGTYSKEVSDFILGYGEQWSAKILVSYLSNQRNVIYVDAYSVIFVYEKNGILSIDWEKSQTALEKFLGNKTFDQLIIPGFIAATIEGKRTTLGRNGSDFSSAIIAKLFNAKSLTIWTNVNGIYSADPLKVRSSFVIEDLSYKEALELAYFGAKVLHPQTIAPVLKLQIPIFIKNSYQPHLKGTYISALPKKSPHLIKGLTSIEDIAIVNIEGAGMIGVSGMAARVFEILRQATISVTLISQASSEHSICFAIDNKVADEVEKILKDNFRFEIDQHVIEGISIDKHCAIIAAVGDEMIGTVGISGKLCASLAKANINISAISQGSSERNISVVIRNSDVERALQALHASFYLSPKTISIGLIGPGKVGSTLLQQINLAIDQLYAQYQVKLCVRGVMNSHKMILSHEPINLVNWQEQLENSEMSANLASFANHILSDDVLHAVMIDCTANQSISQHYIDFIKKDIHVVTPNKHANAGDYSYYKQLKMLSQQKNTHYLYEATVCAGLPIINTLQDIIKTGDEVIKIEGIVSGTLSYIFNELSTGKAFADIVREAKALGFTEPDPREDLSGMDVARKLVCLAREIGHGVSLSDVKVTDLVPPALKSCSVEEFLSLLPLHSQQIETMVDRANAMNEKLSYVGTITKDGILKVAIESVPHHHPFASLKQTDNMLIFHTRRYQTQPLVIQGPGAGAEVTSAGIFADLLRLVSFLS